jgi:hypothetical protein
VACCHAPLSQEAARPARARHPFDLGLDLAVVADKLGHADPNFAIRRYIRIRGNPDTAAMAVTDEW